MSSFLTAAVQLTSSPDPDANLAAAEEQIELAARRGAELVGLPENFAFMGSDSRRIELAPLLAERCSRFPVPAGEGV
ncbi:MAG: nitrilase-related carbon-nitrogen hydrolase, partial [Cyanobacteriota bacterium]